MSGSGAPKRLAARRMLRAARRWRISTYVLASVWSLFGSWAPGLQWRRARPVQSQSGRAPEHPAH
eukprot:6266942-Alexandrium_andersonii.AAC.1